MKIVVLGGAGVMGSYAAKFLADKVNVVVADLNVEKAREIAGEIGGEYARVNATNEDSIKEVVRGADAVINAIGPFYKFAYPVLKSVIDAGVNYVDICDDYDVTLKLLELNERAKEKNIACIIGLGASPGITNVASAYAAQQMDEVDEVKIYVTRSIKEEAGGAIPYHMLHAWLGEVPVYEDGEFKKMRGLRDGEEWVKFPQPFGDAAVYYFGHPETVTLPRYIQLKNAACKGTFFPQTFRNFLLQLDSIGLISDEKIDVGGVEISPVDFLAKFVNKIIGGMKSQEMPEGGAVMVVVKGRKDGKEVAYEFSGTARMREATATPAALAAVMMAKGEISFQGVASPEGAIPPKEFLNELLKTDAFGKVWMSVKKEIEEL